jgi:TRAP-type C4-dicarboxylate transport system permease small subunit
MYAVVARWLLSNQLVERLCAVGLAAITLFMFSNVVLRYGFNAPIAWGDELTQFAFIWLVFLGAVAAMKTDSHYSLTLLIDNAPRPIAALLCVIGDLAVIAICAAFAWHGFKLIQLFSFQTSPSLELPISVVYASLPLSSVLMIIVRAVKLVEHVRVRLLGRRPVQEKTPAEVELIHEI